MVTDPSKSNRWLKVIIAYQNEGKLVPCPFCQGKLTVEELTIGRGSVTFQCQNCSKMAHFDCKIRESIENAEVLLSTPFSEKCSRS